MKYLELKKENPVMENCFFAFRNEQLAEGLKKFNLEKKDIVSGGFGLYGTREGILKFNSFYETQNAKIAAECNPQDVYEYEFNNHESEFTCDDTEAIQIVAAIFGDEKAMLVNRRAGTICCEIKDLQY